MVVVDIRLSEPEELLEDEEDLRKPLSSPSDWTTSLAAAVHFSLDCFLVIFFGGEERDAEELEAVVLVGGREAEKTSFANVFSLGLRIVLAQSGGSFAGTEDEAGADAWSAVAVLKEDLRWVTPLQAFESLFLSFKEELEWTSEGNWVGVAWEQSAVSFNLSPSISSLDAESLFAVSSWSSTFSRSWLDRRGK